MRGEKWELSHTIECVNSGPRKVGPSSLCIGGTVSFPCAENEQQPFVVTLKEATMVPPQAHHHVLIAIKRYLFSVKLPNLTLTISHFL